MSNNTTIPTMPSTRKDRMYVLRKIYREHRQANDQYATGLYINRILSAWDLSLSTRRDYLQSIVSSEEPDSTT